MRAPLFILVLILLASSCTTLEPCDEDSVSELVAVFKSETGGELNDTTVSGLSIYGIREGQSTWLLYDSLSLSKILLPLDPHHDFSRFVFFTSTQSDTLTINHSSEIYLISYSCGFGMQFTLESDIKYGTDMIAGDSILIPNVNSTLETEDTHIWLYF